jgi:hypothetical protein
MMLQKATGFGQFYWCVKVTEEVAKTGEIYLDADDVYTSLDGALNLVHHRDDGSECTNLMLPAGKWLAVYAASVINDSPVAVKYWEGEV